MTDSYRHLRYDEREALAKMRDAAVPVCEIAARLGRHRSTIYRELRRYFMHDEEAWFRGYFPNVTQKEPAVAGLLVVSLNATWS
jgi:IS30 family transposase